MDVPTFKWTNHTTTGEYAFAAFAGEKAIAFTLELGCSSSFVKEGVVPKAATALWRSGSQYESDWEEHKRLLGGIISGGLTEDELEREAELGRDMWDAEQDYIDLALEAYEAFCTNLTT